MVVLRLVVCCEAGVVDGGKLELSLEVMELVDCSDGDGLGLNCLILSFQMSEVGWEMQRIHQVPYTLEC